MLATPPFCCGLSEQSLTQAIARAWCLRQGFFFGLLPKELILPAIAGAWCLRLYLCVILDNIFGFYQPSQGRGTCDRICGDHKASRSTFNSHRRGVVLATDGQVGLPFPLSSYTSHRKGVVLATNFITGPK